MSVPSCPRDDCTPIYCQAPLCKKRGQVPTIGLQSEIKILIFKMAKSHVCLGVLKSHEFLYWSGLPALAYLDGPNGNINIGYEIEVPLHP